MLLFPTTSAGILYAVESSRNLHETDGALPRCQVGTKLLTPNTWLQIFNKMLAAFERSCDELPL